MSKTIEEIKNQYAHEISYMDWFTMTMRQMRITDNQVNEVAKRYAKEQNKDIIEMLELMCMDIEELGKGRGVAYRMAKKLLTKYK